MTNAEINALKGEELAAAVAREVFHRKDIGYYGPPASGPWRHDKSVRFDTRIEAVSAYRKYHAQEGGSRFGIQEPDDFEPSLCYWVDGWGPRMCGEYDRDIATAWEIVEWIAVQADRRIRNKFDKSMEGYWLGPASEVAKNICREVLRAVRKEET